MIFVNGKTNGKSDTMTTELRDSPFLGERTISFVASIINTMGFNGSSGSGLNPVTDFEKKLLSNQARVREINDELNNELVMLLKNAKDYIPPHTAMRILLYAYSKDFLEQAYEIVYFAARDRLVLTDKEINILVAELKKDPNAQVQWLMTLYAGDKEEELVAPDSSFKLPKDFQ